MEEFANCVVGGDLEVFDELELFATNYAIREVSRAGTRFRQRGPRSLPDSEALASYTNFLMRVLYASLA
ncbi:hypothetical protein LTR54_017808 [Friedmanniomyces endolithicus]|uniref:Uncharacterized protein n=1 Tax=Friedmanniomyces endolithicus TaxID=329885 RepID=A0AAN6F3M9_9PEZI|nr:hypothetical protein LTR82_017762 [Friedmanniomyces endolithicus]KAK0971374.1 hypothetical protein LTR54_017808 [Friedmanniomyces endolithicus]